MSARCLPNIRRMGWDVRRKFAVCLPDCPPDFRRMSSNVRRIVLQNVRIEGPGGFLLNIRQMAANVRQIICQIVRRMNARLSVRKHPAENTADIRRTIRWYHIRWAIRWTSSGKSGGHPEDIRQRIRWTSERQSGGQTCRQSNGHPTGNQSDRHSAGNLANIQRKFGGHPGDFWRPSADQTGRQGLGKRNWNGTVSGRERAGIWDGTGNSSSALLR